MKRTLLIETVEIDSEDLGCGECNFLLTCKTHLNGSTSPTYYKCAVFSDESGRHLSLKGKNRCLDCLKSELPPHILKELDKAFERLKKDQPSVTSLEELYNL